MNRLSNATWGSPPAAPKVMFITAKTDAELGRGESVCHICLTKTSLTKEHVPPRAAFNKRDRVWQKLDTKRVPTGAQQALTIRGGFRVPTLCRNCNNSVCAPYVGEYVILTQYIHEIPAILPESGVGRLLSIPVNRLLVAKQIAAMILAIESIGFAEKHPHLREFVMDRHRTCDPGFSVFAFIVPDHRNAGTIQSFHGRADTYAPGWHFTGGEVSMYPFGFVYAMSMGPRYRPDRLTDITPWFRTIFKRECRPETFFTRLTVIDANATMAGFRRDGPQLSR